MKRIKLMMTLLMMFSAFITIQAQEFSGTSKVGTTAANFLKIGAGARALGMGGAYVALSSDIYGAYWNPAGLATSESQFQASFNHSEWLADMSYDWVGASLNLGMGVLFTNVTLFSVPDEPVRTFENPQGDGREWDAGDMAIGLGFAKMLTDRFSIGGQFKYVRQAVWNMSASGFAVDIGTLYRTPFNDLMIGAAISNFGSKLQLTGRDDNFNYDPDNDPNQGPNNIPANYQMEEFDMPLTFRVGLSMDVIKNRFTRVTAAVDAVHPNDNSEYMNTGLEIAYDEMFFVRGGYKSIFMNNREQTWTVGGGLNYDMSGMKVMINYAWSDYGRLESIHFIDLGITM